MTTTRDEDINLETGSMCQSVIFGSLTLIWKLDFDFGEKVIFQNFEPTLSCSSFSRQQKIWNKMDQEQIGSKLRESPEKTILE